MCALCKSFIYYLVISMLLHVLYIETINNYKINNILYENIKLIFNVKLIK